MSISISSSSGNSLVSLPIEATDNIEPTIAESVFSFPNGVGNRQDNKEYIEFVFLDLGEFVPNAAGTYKTYASPADQGKSAKNVTAISQYQVTTNPISQGVAVAKTAGKILAVPVGWLDDDWKKTMTDKIDQSAPYLKNQKVNFTRTKEVIKLMMPNNISYRYGASWVSVSASPSELGMLAQVVGDIDTLGAQLQFEGTKIMSSILYEQGAAVAESAMGKTINYFASQAFQGMGRRNFRFEWLLTPKNKEELEIIKQIIYYFKYHIHPTLDKQFLYYPSQIEATFKSGNTDNLELPKMATSIIKDVSINYTPNSQWTAIDGTSASYQYHLQVEIEEIVPLVKQDIKSPTLGGF